MLQEQETYIIETEKHSLPFFVKLDFDWARMEWVSAGLFDEDMLIRLSLLTSTLVCK